MNWVLFIIFTLIIIASIITYWYITSYIKLHHDVIRINEAAELIKNALDERYELVIGLKTIVRRNTKMDINIFKELEDTKNTNTPLNEFDKMITKAINTLYQIQNDYPKLETKKDFKNALIKLEETDTKINAIKNFYNTYNNDLFDKLKKLPNKLVAKIHKFEVKQVYEADKLFNELDDGIKI